MAKIQIYRTEQPHASSTGGGSKCDCPDLQLNSKDVEVVDGIQNINACTQIKTNNSEYSVDRTGTIKLTNLAQTVKVNDKLYDADDDGVVDLGTIGGGDANVKIKVNNVEHEATEGVVDLGNLANRIVIDDNEYYTDADGAIEVNNLDYVKKVDNLDDYQPDVERAVYNRADDNYYKTEWREDDVATACLGEDWRLPTADEMAELATLPVAYDSTTMTFTITASNGATITIPACGARRSGGSGGDYDKVGTAVGLWTSQRADWAEDAVWAYWLDEITSLVEFDEFNLRYEGYAILPVTTTTAVGSVDLGLSVRWANALLGKDKTLNNSNPIHVQWGSVKNTESGDYYEYEFAVPDGYGFTEYNFDDEREVLGMTPLWKKVGDEGGQVQTIEVNADVEGLETNSLNNLVVDGQAYLADDIYVRITSTDYRKVIQPGVVKGKQTRTLNLQTGWSVKQLGNFGKTDYIAILSNVDLQGVAKTADTAALAATNYNAWLRIGVTDGDGNVHYGSVIDSYNANLLNANQVQNYVLPYVGGGSGGSTVIANTEGVDASIILNNISIDGQIYDTNPVRAISVNQGEHYYTPSDGQFDINVATSATLNNSKVLVDKNGVLALPPTASKLRVDGVTYDVTPQGIIDIDTDISQYISFDGARSLGGETYNNTIPVTATVDRQPLDDGSDQWEGVNTVGMWAVWADVAKGGTYVTHSTLEDGFMIMTINYTLDIVEMNQDEGYGQSVYDRKIVFDLSQTCRINVTIDYDVTRDIIKGIAVDKRDESNMIDGIAVAGAQIRRTTTTGGEVDLSAWRFPRLVLKMHDLTKQYTCAASSSFPRTNRRVQRLVVDQQVHTYEAKYYNTLIYPKWVNALGMYRWETKESETGIPHAFTVYINRDQQVVNQDGQALYNITIKEEYETTYDFLNFNFMNLVGEHYDGYDWEGNEVHIPRAHVVEDENQTIYVDNLTMRLSYPDLRSWDELNYIPMPGTAEYKTGTLAVYHSARKIKFGGRIYDVDVNTGIIDLDA